MSQAQFEQWTGFKGKLWKDGVDVRDFIQNITSLRFSAEV